MKENTKETIDIIAIYREVEDYMYEIGNAIKENKQLELGYSWLEGFEFSEDYAIFSYTDDYKNMYITVPLEHIRNHTAVEYVRTLKKEDVC